jgi:hypothetical protein
MKGAQAPFIYLNICGFKSRNSPSLAILEVPGILRVAATFPKPGGLSASFACCTYKSKMSGMEILEIGRRCSVAYCHIPGCNPSIP